MHLPYILYLYLSHKLQACFSVPLSDLSIPAPENYDSIDSSADTYDNIGDSATAFSQHGYEYGDSKESARFVEENSDFVTDESTIPSSKKVTELQATDASNDWQRYYHNPSGRHYEYNQVTNESRWVDDGMENTGDNLTIFDVPSLPIGVLNNKHSTIMGDVDEIPMTLADLSTKRAVGTVTTVAGNRTNIICAAVGKCVAELDLRRKRSSVPRYNSWEVDTEETFVCRVGDMFQCMAIPIERNQRK